MFYPTSYQYVSEEGFRFTIYRNWRHYPRAGERRVFWTLLRHPVNSPIPPCTELFSKDGGWIPAMRTSVYKDAMQFNYAEEAMEIVT